MKFPSVLGFHQFLNACFKSIGGRKLWIFPLLAIAIWLRWGGMDENRSLWLDETVSMWGSRDGWGYQVRYFANTPGISCNSYFVPYCFFRLADWLTLTGSLTIMRLPFLACGLLSIALAWRLGRLWKNWISGVVFATILTVWPFLAYWNTCIRFYSTMVLSAVALLTAWEAFRRKPDWSRYAIGLAVAVVAPLNTIMAVPLIMVPWIYCCWDFLRRLYLNFKTRRLSPAPLCQGWRFVTGRGVLLLLATLLNAYMMFGFKWTNQKLIQPFASPEAAQAASVAEATPAAKSQAAKTKWTHYIDPGILATDTVLSIKTMFTPGRWTPAPLFKLAGHYQFFHGVLFGSVASSRPGDGLNICLVVVICIGSIALLINSPPLFFTCVSLILIISNMLALNADKHFLDGRYYTIPTIGLFVLAAAGIECIIGWLRWPLRRWKRRWDARLAVGFGLVCLVAPVVMFGKDTRQAAQYVHQDWLKLYRDIRAQFPGGAIISGMDGNALQIFHDLDLFRNTRPAPADYWHSPWMTRVTSAYLRPYSRGYFLLHQANAREAIAFFSPCYWGRAYEALDDAATYLGPPRRRSSGGLNSVVYDLENKVFIGRGRAEFPLVDRFLAKPRDSQGCRYDIKEHFEIPGAYTLSISEPSSNPLQKVMIDGVVQPFTRQPWVSHRDTTDSMNLWRDINLVNPDVYPLRAEFPAYPEPPVIDAGMAPNVPLLSAAQPWKPQTISLVFSKPLDFMKPLVRWEFMEPRWRAISAGLELGGLVTWDADDALWLALPCRMQQFAPGMYSAEINFCPDGEKKPLATVRFAPEAHGRARRVLLPGDAALSAPLKLPNGEAATLVGKTFAISMKVNYRGKPVKPDPAKCYQPRQEWLVGYVRIVNQQGHLVVLVGHNNNTL